MKRTILIAVPIIVLCVVAFTAKSEPKRGPFPLVDVSGSFEAGPGFEIIDAYSIPKNFEGDYGMEYDLYDGLEGTETVALSSSRFLYRGRFQLPGETTRTYGTFLFDLETGIFPVLTGGDFKLLGLQDGVLLVSTGTGEEFNYSTLLIRVTGDWDSGTGVGDWGKM